MNLKIPCICLGALCFFSYVPTNTMEKTPFSYFLNHCIGQPNPPLQFNVEPTSIIPFGSTQAESSLQLAYKIVHHLFQSCIVTCYKHPKFFFSTAITALLLLSLKRSVITRNDLNQLKKELHTITQNQMHDLLKTDKNDLKKNYKKISSDFDNSEKAINALQTQLDQSQHKLNQMPEDVQISLARFDIQEQNIIQEICNSTEQKSDTPLTQLRTYQSHQGQEFLYEKLFAQLYERVKDADSALNFSLQGLMQLVAHEQDALSIIMHQQAHQEQFQIIPFQNSITAEAQSIHAQLDSLIRDLTNFSDQKKEALSDKKL